MPKSPFVKTLALPRFPAWERSMARNKPLSFELELTARCQHDCRHCYVNLPADDAAARARELTPTEISDIADQAVGAGALWCLLTGGEPLLRPDFPEIYEILRRKGLLLTIFTNGGLVTDEIIRLFRKAPPRGLEITVYGATEETYDRVTRLPGSFAAFRRGLEGLLRAGVKTTLKTMILRSNVHELSFMKEMGRAISGKDFRCDPNLALRFDRNPARNREIIAERLSPEEIVSLEAGDPEIWTFLKKTCKSEPLISSPDAGDYPLFMCGAGTLTYFIRSDGTFCLCSALTHPDFTFDLRRGSITKALQTFVPKIRSMKLSQRPFYEKCYSCPQGILCSICPGIMYLETGELNAWSDYFCRIGRLRETRFQQEEIRSGKAHAKPLMKEGRTKPRAKSRAHRPEPI